MFPVPRPAFFGRVPFGSLEPDGGEVLFPPLPPVPFGVGPLVLGEMAAARMALQILDAIVARVLVLVVDIVSFRDGTMVELPYIPVQEAARPGEIPAKVNVRAVRIPSVIPAIEPNHFLANSLIFERHPTSSGGG